MKSCVLIVPYRTMKFLLQSRSMHTKRCKTRKLWIFYAICTKLENFSSERKFHWLEISRSFSAGRTFIAAKREGCSSNLFHDKEQWIGGIKLQRALPFICLVSELPAAQSQRKGERRKTTKCFHNHIHIACNPPISTSRRGTWEIAVKR